jgi:hypothetical protein
MQVTRLVAESHHAFDRAETEHAHAEQVPSYRNDISFTHRDRQSAAGS